jgi:hypothetical protein
VSWLDNDSSGSPAGGYDVFLQRLDANGIEQWVHGGLTIADRGFSWTMDYDLDVDAADNALLAFRDDRSGATQIAVTKVDLYGTQVWGGSGVQVTTSTTAFYASPKVAATTDGYVVAAWTQDADTVLQKLDLYGNPLWGAGVVLGEGGAADYAASGLVASDNGSAIVCWVRSVGFPSNRHLYANKVSTNGSLLWGPAHVAILDSGSLQFGNFPGCISDGMGGALWGFYTNSPTLQCYAQHVLANGTEAFVHNGILASTAAARFRVQPDIAYDMVTGETYLFFVELSLSQADQGVYAQKFDPTGNLLWGTAAMMVTPLSSNAIIGVRTLATTSGAMVAWIEAQPGSDVVRAARFDAAGGTLCAPFMVSSALGGKSRLAGALSSVGVAHYAWQDGRNASDDIYAQNVNTDCTLGGVYPGTGDDFVMISGTNGLLSAADVKTAQPNDMLTVELVSPLSTFAPYPPLLVGQLFPTAGPAPSLPGYPEIHIHPSPTQPSFFLLTGTGTPIGTMGLPASLSFSIPSGLNSYSVMLQAISFAGLPAITGMYGTTDGHEIRFIP